MPDVFALARRCGVRVEYADLGPWGPCELRSEYDPAGPAIRINTRVLGLMPPDEAQRMAELAVAHELYHHREARGEVARLTNSHERERAADAFARDLVERR